MIKKIITLVITLFLVNNVQAALKINEIYPAPESGEFEWVEVYNDEDKTIDLNGYFLTDATNKKLKLNGDNIAAFGYVIATASSGVLNNSDGDTVILKNNNNETVESIAYSGSFNAEKSYFRCPNGGNDWFSSITITKNVSNETACNALTPTPTPTPTPTVTPTPHPTTTPILTHTPTPSPTPKPTPLSGVKGTLSVPTPTLKLASLSASTLSFIEATPTTAVLGAKTERNNRWSIAAVIFSLLTIIVVFLKMKIRHEKGN